MSGAQIAKLASSFSLLLVVAACWASTYRDLARALESANTPGQVERISNQFSDLLDSDEDLAETVDLLGDGATVEEVKRMVALRVAGESPPEKNASAKAKAIKANPLYRDPGIQEQSNWLSGALKRIADLIPRPQPPSNVSVPNAGILGWFVPMVWVILAALVLVLGYFLLKHVSWKRALKRKAKAVLEEDEPERTLDEWLALADNHTAEGRFREAVRAMYLSCLLKFDEAGVARFIRGETNWEHLARISSSIKKPESIDFRPPTQAFDRIWYGYHVKGREDVEQFRAWYQEIVEALRSVRK
jgi:hypothetical protein